MPVLDRAGGALPALGTTFPLQITQLPAQPGAVYLAFGWSVTQWNGVALPAGLGTLGLPGCGLWIVPEPGAGTLLLHAGTVVSYALALPNVAAFAGLRVVAQALVFDAAAANGIGAVSNAGLAILH
jgi:hypothetical protein